jgi:hypothetical protein
LFVWIKQEAHFDLPVEEEGGSHPVLRRDHAPQPACHDRLSPPLCGRSVPTLDEDGAVGSAYVAL